MDSRLGRSLSVAVRLAATSSADELEIGSKLTEMGADELVDGGFLILHSNQPGFQYFSPKFKFITGYSKKELKSPVDFYNIISTDKLIEFQENLETEKSFQQSFVVETKSKRHILLYCDISLVRGGMIIIGINKILKK